MNTKFKFFMLSILGSITVFFALILGCNDTSTNPPTYINNPNVRTFDSIGVEQDSAAFINHTGIDLLNGVNTVDSAKLRDCSLGNLNEAGIDFTSKTVSYLMINDLPGMK